LENSLLTALTITVIGMSLLCLSLVLFYGLLSLLAGATKDRPSRASRTAETGVREGGEKGGEEALLRAAAVAIAMARAQAERTTRPEWVVAAPAGDQGAADRQVSPWWALHHQRQMALKRDR
jgi:hypothetical protein